MASSSRTPAKTCGGSPMDEEHPGPEVAPPLVASAGDRERHLIAILTLFLLVLDLLKRFWLAQHLTHGMRVGKCSHLSRQKYSPHRQAGKWLVKKEDAAADAVWVPPFQEILDLKIQRKDVLAVPIKFDFQCLRASDWEAWVDKELADEAFCGLLEQAGVLQAILISRSLNMYRDTESLRQLVRRWCPSTHTFFFAHGELTVTLEDVENHWRLPILGDCDPSEVELSPAEIKAEAIFYCSSTQLCCKLFLWEHAASYSTDGRRPSDSRQKFASMPEAVAARFEFPSDLMFPAFIDGLELRFYDSELVPSLDDEDFVLWRPYGDSHRGYFLRFLSCLGSARIEPQNYALGPEDIRTLSYLSVTSAEYEDSLGYDQEVPATMAVIADALPTINPFIKSRAFAYWSSTIPEVVIPSGDRIGICTMGMIQYWRGLMTSMLEFRSSGHESIEHLFPLCKAPSTNPQLFAATNTVTTYSTKQGLGYVVWRKKVASKRGKRITATVSGSKRKKSAAPEKSISKGIVIREPETSQSGRQPVPKDVSGKKIVRKTRAKRKRFAALPSPILHESPSSNTRSKRHATATTYSEARTKQRNEGAVRRPLTVSRRILF
uniref:Aminotransferase-like plant mobile domain-containing protein n=1 Tax=Fagus sylvatica TaxID=28930 RepID=A0A2N9FC47_FAGSY